MAVPDAPAAGQWRDSTHDRRCRAPCILLARSSGIRTYPYCHGVAVISALVQPSPIRRWLSPAAPAVHPVIGRAACQCKSEVLRPVQTHRGYGHRQACLGGRLWAADSFCGLVIHVISFRPNFHPRGFNLFVCFWVRPLGEPLPRVHCPSPSRRILPKRLGQLFLRPWVSILGWFVLGLGTWA